MIKWRTDIENAPKDGTKFLVPNPYPPLNGKESGIYVNVFFPPRGDKEGRFSLEGFKYWTKINLPEES